MIKAPLTEAGKLHGLCGNFNSDLSDDKANRYGQLLRSTKEFGESWSIPGPPCESQSCSQNTQSKAWNLCNTIKFPPFNKCAKEVDKEGFLSSCIEKTCECLSTNDFDERLCRYSCFQAIVE